MGGHALSDPSVPMSPGTPPRAGARGWLAGAHAKIGGYLLLPDAMDIERINQIGNSLADLTSRTEALRRYL